MTPLARWALACRPRRPWAPSLPHSVLFGTATGGPTEPRDRLLTLPNVLSASRIVVSPLLALWVVHGSYGLALGAVGYCAATDVVHA